MAEPTKELQERAVVVKKMLKDYGAGIKRGVPQLMSREDVRLIGRFLKESREAGGSMAGYRQAYDSLSGGDIRHIEDVPPEFVAFLASAKYYREAEKGTVDYLLGEPDDAEAQAAKTRDLMFEPLLRRGLELASMTAALPENERENAGRLSAKFNETVMNLTITPPDPEAVGRLRESVGGDDAECGKILEKNEMQQLIIAKSLFLTQLGGAYLMQKNGKNAAYAGSCSELFVHGGRTVIQLPKGKSEMTEKLQADYLSYVAGGQNKGSCVETRFAATHSADVKKSGEIKETSDTSILSAYGCNPAVGGLGRLCNGRMIRNDGSDGHMFVKAEAGTAKKNGYLMIGFEGESTFSTGKTGHFHGPAATSAQFSAFMAGKNGLSAAGKGGRVVDLSGMDPAALDRLILAFNERWDELHHGARAAGPEQISGFVAKLSGPMMNADQMADFLTEYGIASGMDVKALRSGAQARFEALNKTADEKTAQKAAKMGLDSRRPLTGSGDPLNAWRADPGKVKFELSVGMQNVVNKLEKDKRKILFIKVSDSPEMVKVKTALEMINNKRIDGSLNLENSLDLFRQLSDAAGAYVDNPDKAENARKKDVRVIKEFADSELAKIREQRKALMNDSPVRAEQNLGAPAR